jgi:hypothetical protein
VMDVEENASVDRLCSPDCVGNSEHCNCVSGGVDVIASDPEDCGTRQERIPEAGLFVRIGAASSRKLLRRREIQSKGQANQRPLAFAPPTYTNIQRRSFLLSSEGIGDLTCGSGISCVDFLGLALLLLRGYNGLVRLVRN